MDPAEGPGREPVVYLAGRPEVPAPDAEDPDAPLLRTIQRTILLYPLAAQALFSALVREGRAYAETPEGARTKAALARSPLMKRGRTAWEVLTLNILRETPDSALPSALLDAFTRLLEERGVEARLNDILGGRDAVD